MVRAALVVVGGYALIGVVLAVVMVESYGWGIVHNRCDTPWEQELARARAQAVGLWQGIGRFVFWGPSLARWALDQETDYSFWQWIAPGAWTGCGQAAV